MFWIKLNTSDMPKHVHIARFFRGLFGKNRDGDLDISDEDSQDISDDYDEHCSTSTPTDLATLRQKARDSKTEREERRALKRKAKEEQARIEIERIEKQKKEIKEEYRSAIEPYILKCIARGNGHHEKRIHINWLKFEKFGYLPVAYDITTGYESVPKKWYNIYWDVVDDICEGLQDDGIMDDYEIKSTVVTLCL